MTTIALNRAAWLREKLQRLLQSEDILITLGLVAATVATFAVFAFVFNRLPTDYLDEAVLFFAFAGAGAATFLHQAKMSIAPYRMLCRAISVIMGFYIFALYPAFGVVDTDIYQQVSPIFTVGRWLAIACAVLGLVRPAACLIPCFYAMAYRLAVNDVSGFATASSDFIVVAELGLFLSFGMLLVSLADHTVMRGRDQKWHVSALGALLLAAIGIHFSNYFTSGIEKLALDGGLLSWVLENKTHYLVLSGHYMGTLPLGKIPELAILPYRAMEAVGIGLNLLTLVAQLVTVLAVVRVRWIIALTLFFDAMHIAIFLISGINFWIWVLLNLAIVAACVGLKSYSFPRYIRFTPIVFVVFAPKLFHIAALGWYDSRSVNDLHFVAITSDGQSFRVPSNYFFANSYGLYHRNVVGPPDDGHFVNGPWGSIWSANDMRLGNRCELPLQPSVITDPVKAAKIDRFMKAHHAYILKNVDQNGRIDYDWYPHHHFTNPLYYRDFAKLDKREIVKYRFVMDSVCLTYEGGEFKRQVKRSTEQMINVR